MGHTVWVHFSFRRPKHKKYGIFAVAMYGDEEGRHFLGSTTRAFKLWKDQQYVTAIQSYEHALYCIWEDQSKMERANVDNIILMTDNSTLAKWIEDNNKRPDYAPYMKRAVEQYQVGGNKQIYVNIALHEPLKSEKSHKFCREELIQNKRPVATAPTERLKSIDEIIAEDRVTYSGIEDNTAVKRKEHKHESYVVGDTSGKRYEDSDDSDIFL